MSQEISVQRVNASEFRDSLGAYFDELDAGETAFVIERRGKPIAVLLDIVDALDLAEGHGLEMSLRDAVRENLHLPRSQKRAT
jgi:hypothetical protein